MSDPQVIVYSDAEYKGASHALGVGVYDGGFGIKNDSLSSVKVPAGYRVTLYQDGGFKGRSVELTQDTPHLNDFNDRTSSIIIDRIDNQRAPTMEELIEIIHKVGPRVYYHPEDDCGPSSVEWFLKYATLHKKADGTSCSAASAPLPAGGSDDMSYWLDVPGSARGGDYGTAVAYVNAKYKNNWLDIQFWFFYPYNGAGVAKITVAGFNGTIKLDPMGEHGGDWEHVACRVDPGSKALRALYLAEHSGGTWLSLGDIPMEDGRPVAFSSRHGHASYRGEGDNLSNSATLKELGVTWFQFGLVNGTKKGSKVLECHSKYQLLRADFLGDQITAPDWTKYGHRWGPQISYKSNDVKQSIRKSLGSIPEADKVVDAIWNAIPDEAKEENGPTGPWMKGSWSGDE